MAHDNSFMEIAAILALATVLGAAGRLLKQPPIIMFLLAGILAGPACFGIIDRYEQIELLAHIGIALLLFVVGLKLDLNLIATTGPVALATGLGQIVFTSAIGLLIALAMGMNLVTAAYVAVALTFSSTIIIVKLLSDKKEIDSLHGQIAIGFLIVQDIAAIVALVVLTTFGSGIQEGESVLRLTLVVLLKGTALLAGVWGLIRWVLPRLLRYLSHSPEMLVLMAISWAVLLGAVSEWLGFSKEVGAFLAGIALASTDYRDAIGSRLTSLRDFLLIFFFIDLGARLDWSTVSSQIVPALGLSFFVLVGNPLIVMAIMGYMGYRRRTGFMAGLAVAQISEFSLIVAALGMSLGHISPETMGLVTLVGVITIFVSTYMILYSIPLYRIVSDSLKWLERRHPYREESQDTLAQLPAVDVILVGLGNYGSGLAGFLLRRQKQIVGVDFDPAALKKWRDEGVPVRYGDVADPEFLDHLPLARTQWVASTVRSQDMSLTLLRLLRQRGFAGKIALTATSAHQAERYIRAGAQVIFRPFQDAAEQAADALTHAMGVLPEAGNLPIAFREIRIQSGSAYAGQIIRNIPLRTVAGVSILAVSRAGRLHYDPNPDFAVYPGDRLVLMGVPHELIKAETLLNQFPDHQPVGESERLALTEVPVEEASGWEGQTLIQLQFRGHYGVTVAAILRQDAQIILPGPHEVLHTGDRLVVIGATAAIDGLRDKLALHPDKS